MVKQNSYEKRRSPRLLLSLPMHIQGVNEVGERFNERCESINMSTGGVYYEGLQKPSQETEAIVTFDLPFDNVGNFRILKTRGRVIRVEKGTGVEKGIALKFLEELRFFTPYNRSAT